MTVLTPELLVGAVVGAILGYVLPKSFEWLRGMARSRRLGARRGREMTTEVDQWILDVHKSHEMEPLNGYFKSEVVRVPFFTNEAWCFDRLVGEGEPVVSVEYSEDKFPVDHRALSKRMAIGQRLFDAPAYYFRSIREGASGLQLVVGECSYFEVATSLLALEDETYTRGRLSWYGLRRPRFRDSYFGLEEGKFLGRPFSVATSVALVLDTSAGRHVLLHVRSKETVTYGGMTAVIPYFGLAPLGRTHRVSPSRWRDGRHDEMIESNVVKEYCEELFCRDDLIEGFEDRILDPSYLWSFPEAAQLRRLLDAGAAVLHWTGFGFDGFNGSATNAFVLHIRNVEASEDIVRSIIGNWEVAGRVGGGSIELTPLEWPTLWPLLKGGRLTYGSSFALLRALHVLEA